MQLIRTGTSLPMLSTSYKLFKAWWAAKHEPGKLQVETDMDMESRFLVLVFTKDILT